MHPDPDDPAGDTPLGPRARARQAMIREIVETARRHVAERGAADLSLRAVAREVGIVSSAIHRYFPTRDDLLTTLIVDAYDALGEVAETRAAETTRMTPARRWTETALAIRSWSTAHPHLFALLYGTPVPGYVAPERTVAPGIRVSLALLSIVTDAAAADRLGAGVAVRVPRGLGAQLDAVRAEIAVDLDDATVVRVLAAWTQLFGLLSFEIFGQTRGLVEDDEMLFTACSETMATAIGL